MLNFADFKYGIYFKRSWYQGPEWYPYGIVSHYPKHSLTEIEEDQINRWRVAYNHPQGSYQTGQLRDIYPGNILVDVHIQQSVGSKSLHEWIESNAKHGMLEKITDQHWYWAVDEEHIPYVQEALQPYGFLLCYKP